MKPRFSWRLRRRTAWVRTAVGLSLLVGVGVLSGCWAVWGPLIGVGAAGGAVLATAKGAPSAGPSVSLAGQGGDNGNQPVAHLGEQQLLDHGSGPVVTASPPPTPPATLSPTIATAKGPPEAGRRHTPQSSAKAADHSAKPRHRDHGSGPVMGASSASTLPGELSATTIVKDN